jgi:hypothetical protein
MTAAELLGTPFTNTSARKPYPTKYFNVLKEQYLMIEIHLFQKKLF